MGAVQAYEVAAGFSGAAGSIGKTLHDVGNLVHQQRTRHMAAGAGIGYG